MLCAVDIPDSFSRAEYIRKPVEGIAFNTNPGINNIVRSLITGCLRIIAPVPVKFDVAESIDGHKIAAVVLIVEICAEPVTGHKTNRPVNRTVSGL